MAVPAAPARTPPVELIPPTRNPGRPPAWWGMVSLIVTEAMVFAGLLATYFFLRAVAPGDWPPEPISEPGLRRISVMTVVLWGSSLPVIWAEHGIKKRGSQRQLQLGILLSFLMGLAFLVHQGIEYESLTFGWADNAYASIFYTTTGLHGLHVAVGLAMSLVVQVKASLGKITKERHLTVTLFGMYWHFVDVVWVFVFSSLYLSAHLT